MQGVVAEKRLHMVVVDQVRRSFRGRPWGVVYILLEEGAGIWGGSSWVGRQGWGGSKHGP